MWSDLRRWGLRTLFTWSPFSAAQRISLSLHSVQRRIHLIGRKKNKKNNNLVLVEKLKVAQRRTYLNWEGVQEVERSPQGSALSQLSSHPLPHLCENAADSGWCTRGRWERRYPAFIWTHTHTHTYRRECLVAAEKRRTDRHVFPHPVI